MLNKSRLLASAVAAGAAMFATGAAAADGKGNVYGDIRWSLDQNDGNATPTTYSATNNNSHYGIKASVSERGLTAFGVYEKSLINDGGGADTSRQGYVGLTGDFGTVKWGQFGTAYFEAGRKLDPFFNTTAAFGAGGNSHGLSATFTGEVFGSGFIDNQLAYATPSFGGLTVNAALFVDDADTSPAHDFGVGAEFNNAGITAGVQVLDINSPGAGATANFGLGTDSETVRLYGGLNTSHFGVNVSAEKFSPSAAGDADYLFASAWLGVMTGTRLAAAVGHEDNATGGGTAAEGTSVSLGVFHDVIKNLTSWVAVRRYDGKGPGASGTTADVITLGASYKFNLGFGS